jgi:RimJ/RimL family protein N-acetyltransferase
MGELSVRLRPVTEDDLVMFRRFLTEPGLIGTGWAGFRDAQGPARRFAVDGYLGDESGRLIVEVDGRDAAGFVNWIARMYSGPAKHWEIGIALLPEWRGRGIGWRAQAMLCDYLFRHTPAHRVEAGTRADNIAEQRALEKAGFVKEGTIRAADFGDGRWHDGCIYGRLREDPSPL